MKPQVKTLSLVIPVYNEARHLKDWCEEFFAFKFPLETEFIFVNDAVIGLPRWYDVFYRNNSDTARLTVKRL